MKVIAISLVSAALCIFATREALADPVVASVQQTLKDQGFYYGEVTGAKDADTTAAIRRYQIRNGLQVTGELNAETQKSLGVKGAAPVARSTPPPPPPAAPKVPPVQPARPDDSDLRDDAAISHEPQPPRDNTYAPSPGSPGDIGNPSGRTSGFFAGTPFQAATPDEQTRVIIEAQSLLARRGYYHSEIDGIFGPEMEFALRAYQARFNMDQTGRLDRRTLGALGLLPGQRVPGVTAPRGRVYRPRPGLYAPNGEPIYIPR